jgi:hypothetical protein
MTPDLAQASAFLKLLDPDATSFTFQTFDDDSARKDNRLARVFHGTLADHAESLTDLQSRGAGVFITINATDGTGRKAENITRVRALWLDLDGAPIEPVREWQTPHIEVESSPGKWHAYWLVNDVTLDQFTPLQAALIKKFNGDPAVKDLPRVMRLPGFWHLKPGSAPHMSRVVHTSTDGAGDFYKRLTVEAPVMPAPRRDTPSSLAEVEELLTYVSPDLEADSQGGDKHWHSIIAAIVDVSGGSDEGLQVADAWSSRSRHYDPKELRKRFASFTPGKNGGSGMGTIGYHAKQASADVAGIGARHRLLNMPGPSHVPAGMMPTAPVQGMPSAPRAASVVDLICAKIQENPHEAVELMADEVARLKPVDRETVFDYCKDQGVKIKMQIAVKETVADSRKAAMELRGLIADKNGGPVPNMTNIKRVLCTEEGWRGTFAKSLFDDAVWLRRPDTRQLTDDDVLKVMEVMQSDLFPSIGVETVRHGVQAAAAGNTFHPVREYLESLQWDGVARAVTLFTDYFPCASEDPQYLRAVGEKFLIGAVARVMQPGCKVDTMPVIAGNQGQKKSSGLAALVGDQWYGNDMPDMTQKDAKEWLRGKWMAEVGELSAMRGKDIEHVKNFLSTTSDSYRKSYGHVTQTYPRQTVFAGTVNGNEYLSDETGNRRFWPLQMIDGALVDVAGLERDRGLLWAEALHMYRSGTAWWFDEGESATLSAQQAAARSVDIDETRVVEWLREQEGPVTAGGVAATLFADAPGNKSLSMRVARYLQAAGWRVSKTVMGKKQWDRGRGAEPYVSPSCGGNVMPMTPRR